MRRAFLRVVIAGPALLTAWWWVDHDAFLYLGAGCLVSSLVCYASWKRLSRAPTTRQGASEGEASTT